MVVVCGPPHQFGPIALGPHLEDESIDGFAGAWADGLGRLRRETA